MPKGFYKNIDEILSATGARKYNYTPEGFVRVTVHRKGKLKWLFFRHFTTVMGWAQCSERYDGQGYGKYMKKPPRSRVCYSRKLGIMGD